MSQILDLLRSTAALSGSNANFIEEIYEQYLQDPDSVSEDWRSRFKQLHYEHGEPVAETPHSEVRHYFERLARDITHSARIAGNCLSADAAEKQAAVLRLINAYRVRGHQHARLDPLTLRERQDVPDLSPAFHNLTAADMDQSFNTGSMYSEERMTLRDIIQFMDKVYCGHVGSEYMHITDTEQKRWIQKRLEGYQVTPEIDDEYRVWLLTLITAAEGLERYLHTRYVGQKRFSLEGGESLIPMLDELIQRAGIKGIHEIIIGMAHRGRLNVLTNILGKPPGELFDEFEGRKNSSQELRSGDVKYHMGASTDISTPGKMSMSPWDLIHPTLRLSARSSRARYAPASIAAVIISATMCYLSSSMVIPRLPARAWSWKVSTCRRRVATIPAAQCTSSLTTR